jgi:hypothetical protein
MALLQTTGRGKVELRGSRSVSARVHPFPSAVLGSTSVIVDAFRAAYLTMLNVPLRDHVRHPHCMHIGVGRPLSCIRIMCLPYIPLQS